VLKRQKCRSFASLKDKLTRELKNQQVEQRFVEATKQLEDCFVRGVRSGSAGVRT
jgi:ribosomal protein L29